MFIIFVKKIEDGGRNEIRSIGIDGENLMKCIGKVWALFTKCEFKKFIKFFVYIKSIQFVITVIIFKNLRFSLT
jgi:hypothetical protein